jgi:hypothetical protein
MELMPPLGLFHLLVSFGVLPVQPAIPALPLRTENACRVVTRADVESALGRLVANGWEHNEGVESTCDYSNGTGQITVTIRRKKIEHDVPAELAKYRLENPQMDMREIGGLGGFAYFRDMAQFGGQLNVFRGDEDYLLISVLGFGDSQKALAAAEELARKALDRF